MTIHPQTCAPAEAAPPETTPPGLEFEFTYADLPECLFTRQRPQPVPAPRLLALNHDLARAIGLDPEALAAPGGVALLAGNRLPGPDGTGLALGYGGHQFGGWVPRLGDGRAVLLGEVVGPDGLRRDVHLKGAGRTPWARGGDGRAWLGPVLREYLVAEGMAALGVPTTRALAALATGAEVLREEGAVPGAILVRVAASHLRVGTFQFAYARGDRAALAALADLAIRRHYPQARGALDLLRAVVAAQAETLAAWMAVGFVHGVMNTDNMAISGETIDYGPCAFLDAYHPDTVFSSIDTFGRYAYANQPRIALWNLAQFATALMPLIGEDAAAMDAATEGLGGFVDAYRAAWLRRFAAKLGITRPDAGDEVLIDDLLAAMAAARADFTRTFRALAEAGAAPAAFRDPAEGAAWHDRWHARLAREGASPEARRAAMKAANPAIIPRNHRIAEAIASALAGDLAPFRALSAALSSPYDPAPGTEPFRAAPEPAEEVRTTFCGT